GLDPIHDQAAPVGAPLGRRKDAGVDALIAFGIVTHAARRVEVYGLERPHEGPAQGEPIANPDVDVLDPGDSLLDEAEGLLQQRALQAIHDETVDLTLHHDRRVAGGAQELRRAVDGRRVRPRRGNDFCGGNEIGRIDRVDDKTARPALEVFGERRRQDGRGRARQQGLGRRGGVEPREHSALHFDILGSVLLNVDRILERRFEGWRYTDSRSDFTGRGAVQKIVRLKVGQEPLDIRQCLAWRLAVLVPKGDLATGAGETDRPRPSDEARADNCCSCHAASARERAVPHNVSTLPSTPSDWPDTFRPAGDKRYAIVAATSPAVTIRRIETRSR